MEKALVNDAHAKATQKKYKDAKSYVKYHRMNIGYQVLLKQQQSKSNPHMIQSLTQRWTSMATKYQLTEIIRY